MRLRARLVLLVILAATPALAILAVQALSAYRDARALARERGLIAVRAVAEGYLSALRSAEGLLTTAANLPMVSPESPKECADILRRLSEAHHSREEAAQFGALFAATIDGRVFCSSDQTRTEALSFGDRPYFRAAVARGTFVAGQHVVGRHAGELIVPMALLSTAPQGRQEAVLVMGLRLGWLGQSRALHAPAGGVVTLLDDTGAILARTVDHETWAGRSFPWAKAIESALNEAGEGFAERPGADGVARLFTLKRIEIGPNRFYLLVGYGADEIFGPAKVSLLRGLAVVAFLGLLVLGTAAYGARQFIVEPVRRLSEAARRMSKGDLGVRVAVPRASELAEFAAAFNDMAAALHSRAAQLADANDMLSAIVNSSPFAIFAADAETNVIVWNPASERTFGWSRDEVLGRKYPAVPEDQSESFRAVRARALSGEMLNEYEAVRMRKDGRRIQMRFSAAPLRSDEGALRGTLYIGEDVTERRALEQQLAQAQKMEAVGQLTGGIAHDFNNLLQVILGCADLLFERLQRGDSRRELAELIQAAANRGAGLTRQLLAFSRRQTLEPELLDVNEVVRGLETLLRRTLGETIQLEAMPAADLGDAFVDRGQLESALVNLAVNARDAMPSGGRLIVETANVELDADYAAQHAEVTPGAYVMVAVSDTGAGIPPDVLPRIFEPFFTTKPAGKGTGLGLSMVFGFVKQSKGHVSVYSEVGRGTTIRLYLPRATDLQGAPTCSKESLDDGAVAGRIGAVVLYVEDDPEVRRLGLMQLSDLGYQVLEAASAREALAILSGPERIDLLFTDVVLGVGLNGWELSEKARELRPEIEVLFASGYNETMAARDGVLPAGVQLIRKPYRRLDLDQRIRELLGAKGAAAPRDPGQRSPTKDEGTAAGSSE